VTEAIERSPLQVVRLNAHDRGPRLRGEDAAAIHPVTSRAASTNGVVRPGQRAADLPEFRAAVDLVPSRPGIVVPSLIRASAEIKELDLIVNMEIRVEPGGSWRILELAMTPLSGDRLQHDLVANPLGAITARALRSFRIDSMAREAVGQQELSTAAQCGLWHSFRDPSDGLIGEEDAAA
jgi:hypothetical protein